jgi:S-(hydroxymethyl)glutathione dehydrogenase / alcohol dehydrogenase
VRIETAVLHRAGVEMSVEPLELDDPREGEVRVRMVASGVCHSCLSAFDGSHTRMPKPVVLGDEGAGVVDSVGPGCRLTVGEHVVLSWAPGCGNCRWCHGGRPVLCADQPAAGLMRDGTTRFRRLDGTPVHHYGPATYAPYTVVSERAAIPISQQVPLDVAALIGCSVPTGVGGVVNVARVEPGQSVGVFGCGGIGLNAVQGAALSGAYPLVAIDLLDSKLALAKRLGATHAVRADDTLLDEVSRITGPGLDHAVVAVGSTLVFEQALESLGPAGQLVLLGNPPTGAMATISPHRLLYGERRLVGSVYGSTNPPVDFPRFAELYLAGLLRLDELVSHRYGIEEANEAFRALAAGEQARGLIVFPAG